MCTMRTKRQRRPDPIAAKRPRRPGTWIAALAAALWLAPVAIVAGAPAARALPLYFEGPDGWGFDAADVVGTVHAIASDADWRSAGDPSFGTELSVTASLVGVVGVEPVSPDFAVPLRARVRYTVTNTTGARLEDEILAFTFAPVDPPSGGGADPFPTLEPGEFGLESAGLLYLAFSRYVFGAVGLPDLGPGESWQFERIHVVADDLGGRVVPSPGLALLMRDAPLSVPEPAPWVLVLLAAGAARRARRP
jgi:hypothetical protein